MSEQKATRLLGAAIQKALKNAKTVEEYDAIVSKYLSANNSILEKAIEKYNLGFILDNGKNLFLNEHPSLNKSTLSDEFNDVYETTSKENSENPLGELEELELLSQPQDISETIIKTIANPEEQSREIVMESMQLDEQNNLDEDIGKEILKTINEETFSDESVLDIPAEESIPEPLENEFSGTHDSYVGPETMSDENNDLEIPAEESIPEASIEESLPETEMPVKENTIIVTTNDKLVPVSEDANVPEDKDIEVPEHFEDFFDGISTEVNEDVIAETVSLSVVSDVDYIDRFKKDYAQYVKEKLDLECFSDNDTEKIEKVIKEITGTMTKFMNGDMLKQELDEFYEGLNKIPIDQKIIEKNDYRIITNKTEEGFDYNSYYDSHIGEMKQQYENEMSIIEKAKEEIYSEREDVKDLKKKLKQKEEDLGKIVQEKNMENLEEKLEYEQMISKMSKEISEKEGKIKLLDNEINKRANDVEQIESEIEFREKIFSASKTDYKKTIPISELYDMFSDRFYGETQIDISSINSETLRKVSSVLYLRGMKNESEVLNRLALVYETGSEYTIKSNNDVLEVVSNKLLALEQAREDKNNLYEQAELFVKNNLKKQKFVKTAKAVQEYIKREKYDDLNETINSTISNIEPQLDKLKPKKKVEYKNVITMLKALSEQYVSPLANSNVPDMPYGNVANTIDKIRYLDARGKVSREDKNILVGLVGDDKKIDVAYEGGKLSINGNVIENGDTVEKVLRTYQRLK